MKELHNHIFSDTTCISKETMLRYINKQLPKNELYEVEKHMLDCELCTDAYEGMAYAENSSMLFAIDSKIDQRVGGGTHRAPVIRNLMLAASVLVIVFGAYFTFNYFNNTLNEESGIAFNNEEEPKEETFLEESLMEEFPEGSTNLNNQKSTSDVATISGNLSDKEFDENKGKEDSKYRTVINGLGVSVAEQVVEEDNESSFDYADEVEVAEEIVATKIINAPVIKDEEEKQLELLDDVTTEPTDNRRKDNFKGNIQSESVAVSGKNKIGSVSPSKDMSGELLKKEEKTSKNKTRNTPGSKKRAKSSVNAPSQYYEDGKLAETNALRDRSQQKTVTIDSYKIVDYTKEYQKAYDLKNEVIKTKSVSAGFESKEDKDVAEKEREESIVEVTYIETLKKAISLYKKKKYNEALAQFSVILNEHPDEVNGWFYGGLSDYHLQRYNEADKKFEKVLVNKQKEFDEEAKWHKSLTLIELKQNEKAKILLKEIVKTNGFYKKRAEDKLKTF